MEFRRALRVLAARWWVVVLLAALGAYAAFTFATSYNDRIEPVFEAVAPVAFERFGDGDAAFASRLNTAAAAARVALAAELADPDRGLDTDLEAGELQFTASESDAVASMAAAEVLRTAYLAAEPSATNQEQIRVELERLKDEIIQLRSELQADSVGPLVDPVVEAQRSLLTAQISSLEQRAASLTLQLTYPDLAEGEANDLQAELDIVESLLLQLTTGLSELPPSVPSTEPGLDTIVLSRRLTTLEDDYVTLSLRLLDESAQEGRLDPLRILDHTPAPISHLAAGGAGFASSALIAVLILLFADRLRRPIRGLEDLQAAQPLGSVFRARPGAGVRRPWYPTATGAARRRQVQAIRTALDRLHGPVSIGVTGLATQSGDLQKLAADLAASFASSGRQVLLVDADFDVPSTIPEYGAESPDLADLITPNNSEDSRALIKRSLSERPEVLTNLTALRAGSGIDDPVEALAGHSFRYLVDAAAELEEVMVVALPAAGHPVTHLLSQRLSHLLLVVRKRKATQPALEAIVRDLADRNAEVLGAIILEGRNGSQRRRRAGRKATSRRQRGRKRERTSVASDQHNSTGQKMATRVDTRGLASDPRPGDNPAVVPPTGQYPEPRTTARPQQLGLEREPEGPRHPRGLAADAPKTSQGRHEVLGPDPSLLGALVDHRVPLPKPSMRKPQTSNVAQIVEDSELTIVIDDRGAPPVATRSNKDQRDLGTRYLVDRVLMLLDIGPSESVRAGGLADTEGMVPITSGAGSATAAERLAELLRSHDPGRPPALDEVLTEVLSHGPSNDPIHHWLENEFFEHHQRLTGGHPEVWHLTSRQGAIQVLVRGDRFDADHIALLRNHDVRRTLKALTRRNQDSSTEDKPLGLSSPSVVDVQVFDRELASLLRSGWPQADRYDPAAAYKALIRKGLVAIRAQHPRSQAAE